MFGDQVKSLIRTGVPAGVAVAVTWLATEWSIVLDEDTSAGAAAVAVGVVMATYYAAVRAAEERWPWVGWLLGSAQAPSYGAEVPVKVRVVPDQRSIEMALSRIHEQMPTQVPRR